MRRFRFLLCLFAGFTGIHRFIDREYRIGFLYLFTGGLFGIGWLYDTAMNLKAALTKQDPADSKASYQPPNMLICFAAVIFGMHAIACIPKLSGFLGLIGLAITMPIPSWQALLKKKFGSVIKAAAVIILIVPTLLLSPLPEPYAADEEIPPVAEATAAPTASPMPQNTVVPSAETDYILNTSRKKFHYPECGSVEQMSEKNKETYHGTRDELIENGYSPCGNCKP